jgi:hypothetical protein
MQPLDLTRTHTKRISMIQDTGKEFAATKKSGTCRRFNLTFDDGYKAEYCPVIGQYDQNVKSGSTITFRIIHRGNYGDEIEPVAAAGAQPPAGPAPRPTTTNLNIHPATIALGLSIRYHAEVKQDKSAELSDVFAKAEEIMEWLDRKTNPESTPF